MEIIGNYNNYAAQSTAESSAAVSRSKNTAESGAAVSRSKNTAESSAAVSRSKNTADYAAELAKLVPSVGFRVGNSYATDKTGKTLTVNPKLLEKMQNDPETEKEMKEMIKGVEAMTKLSERLNQAMGWKTVFRHSYIDENGNYCHIAVIRNDSMLNMSDKLREERRKNAEKLLEKQKENAAQKQEELEKNAEKLLAEKIKKAEGGIIHMNDAEFKEIAAAIQEENKVKNVSKEQTQHGTAVDLRI